MHVLLPPVLVDERHGEDGVPRACGVERGAVTGSEGDVVITFSMSPQTLEPFSSHPDVRVVHEEPDALPIHRDEAPDELPVVVQRLRGHGAQQEVRGTKDSVGGPPMINGRRPR